MSDPSPAPTLRYPGLRLRLAPGLEGSTDCPAALARALERGGLENVGSAVPGGRGAQRRIPCDFWGGPLRVRPAVRGGVLAPLLADRHLGPGRALRELDLWLELRAAGIDLPRPAFALSRRRGLFWRSHFASVEVTQAIDGLALLETVSSSRERCVAARVAGRALSALHEAGVVHGDLHLRNLLFERRTEGETHSWRCRMIDLDRARRRAAPASPRERMRDAMRLARSFEKTGQSDAWSPRLVASALSAYCGGDRTLRRALLAQLPREGRRLRRHRLAWRLTDALPLLALVLSIGLAVGCSPAPGPAIDPIDSPRHSLLAVGDTGRTRLLPDLFEGQRSVAAAMADEARRTPVDGLVLLGDNFYWNGLDRAHLVERVRANLVAPYCPFLRLDGPRSAEVTDACRLPRERRQPVPIFAVLGNHDIELPESARLQREVVPEFLPDWRMTRGLAEAIELGHGMSLVLFESEPRIDHRDEIVEALRSALRSARGPWRILATHRPIATDDLGTPWLGGYPSFVRDAIEAEGLPVQLVLAAHHHSLQAFEIAPPTPLLQLGLGSGARTEPPLASPDHPDVRFSRLALGFARIDLTGRGIDERLVTTIFEAPRWPWLAAFVAPKAVARFEVDRAGRLRHSQIP